MDNFKKINISKEFKTLAIAFLIAVIGTTIFATVAAAQYSEKIQGGIAGRVIRFHVIGNSNLEKDQSVKMEVREVVLKEITPLIENSKSKEETKAIVLENMEGIKKVAQDQLAKRGFSYGVQVGLENARFPLKKYGALTMPAGEYMALKISLGQAKGENFWCVMYPPLCFVDESLEEIDEETATGLKNILTDEEYSIVMSSKSQEISPKVKFKIVEWWQQRKK